MASQATTAPPSGTRPQFTVPVLGVTAAPTTARTSAPSKAKVTRTSVASSGPGVSIQSARNANPPRGRGGNTSATRQQSPLTQEPHVPTTVAATSTAAPHIILPDSSNLSASEQLPGPDAVRRRGPYGVYTYFAGDRSTGPYVTFRPLPGTNLTSHVLRLELARTKVAASVEVRAMLAYYDYAEGVSFTFRIGVVSAFIWGLTSACPRACPAPDFQRGARSYH